MTPLLNWLILVAFSLAALPFAHWVVRASLARWQGPKTLASFAFLYALTIAAIAGLSLAAVSFLYFRALGQPDFIRPMGPLKALLVFSGVWYAMVAMIRVKGDAGP